MQRRLLLFLIQIELAQYVHLLTLSLITLPLMDVYRQNDGVAELIQRHFHLTLIYYLHLLVDSRNVYSNIVSCRSCSAPHSGNLGGVL
jgi:hypothetical protein